jgi:hypothetical protein
MIVNPVSFLFWNPRIYGQAIVYLTSLCSSFGLLTINRTQYESPAVTGSVGVKEAMNVFSPNVSNSEVWVAIAPPCWVSKRHWTVVGPFVSMVPSSSMAGAGPAQAPPGTLTVRGLTPTETRVTEALGVCTIGIFARFPAAVVTLTETQQFLLELNGSTMYHHEPSEFLPTICDLCPTVSALRGSQAVPGPRRQLTGTSRGETVGTEGVDVAGGGDVFVGGGVWDGVCVATNRVGEAVTGTVGVSVTGAFDGRLQAVIARASMSVGNAFRNLMVSPFLTKSSDIHDTTGNIPLDAAA